MTSVTARRGHSHRRGYAIRVICESSFIAFWSFDISVLAIIRRILRFNFSSNGFTFSPRHRSLKPGRSNIYESCYGLLAVPAGSPARCSACQNHQSDGGRVRRPTSRDPHRSDIELDSFHSAAVGISIADKRASSKRRCCSDRVRGHSDSRAVQSSRAQGGIRM